MAQCISCHIHKHHDPRDDECMITLQATNTESLAAQIEDLVNIGYTMLYRGYDTENKLFTAEMAIQTQ
jgi:hypothetical protein